MARAKQETALLALKIDRELLDQIDQLAEESFNTRSGIARHVIAIGLRQLLAERET